MSAAAPPAEDHLLAAALVGTARQPWPPPWVDPDTAGPPGSGIDASPGPLPPADPESSLLAAAARRRVQRLLALAPAHSCAADPAGADDECPPESAPAPPAAADALAAALVQQEGWLVEVWLDAAVRHGVTVPAPLWTPLLEAMSLHQRPPLEALAGALGPQGRWFLRRNPGWTHLVAAPPVPAGRPAVEPGAVPDPVDALPAVLARPGPWPAATVDAALAEAITGRLAGLSGRRLAVTLGRRLPLSAYARLAAVAERLSSGPDRPAGLPAAAAWEVWSVVEAVLYRRCEVEAAFDPSMRVERLAPGRSRAGSTAGQGAR